MATNSPVSTFKSEAAQRVSFYQIGAKDLAHRLHIDHDTPLRYKDELTLPSTNGESLGGAR